MKRLGTPALLLLALPLIAADAPRPEPKPATAVWLEPARVHLLPGERRLVYVHVDGVPETGLAAFQVELRYDARVVDVVDPNAGHGAPAFAPLGGSPLCSSIRQRPTCPDPPWMLTTGGRQAYGTSRVREEEGRIVIAYGSAGEEIPGAGGGTLAVLEIVGKSSPRDAGLRIVDLILADDHDPPREHPYVLGGGRRTRNKGRSR